MKQFTTAELIALRDAVTSEIAAREHQINVLSATLSELINTNAPDAVIERIIEAIEIIDAATPTAAEITPADEPQDDSDDEPIIEPEDTDPRKEFIRYARSLGYKGAGFDALLTAYHRDLADQAYQQAEADCRGQLTNAKSRAKGYNPRRFWFCNRRELDAHASDELKTWFDNNGRLMRADLQASILGGKHYAGSGYYN